AEQLTYSISLNGTTILEPSPIGMIVNADQSLGKDVQVLKAKTRSVKDKIHPVVQEKRKTVLDHCNELRLQIEGDYTILFRAYDDGVAYRFITEMKQPLTVQDDLAAFKFPGNPDILLPMESDFFSSQEKNFATMKLAEAEGQLAYLPVIITLENGQRIALTEVHLEDYAGMFIHAGVDGKAIIKGVFPKYPKTEKQRRDRALPITEREEYIAKTNGSRMFPWRLLVIPEADKNLIESDIVYRLAPPLRLKDTDWIQPGKVAWDWWNAMLMFDVDFESGVNTETYLHYIDFASEHDIEYVILDEGWSDPADLFKRVPNMDLDALFAHAKENNVRIIPWVVWLTLDRQMDEALQMFEDLGAAGIKVDFMDRDDQKIVNWYWKVAKKAAEHHLLVDFHGAYKPTGLRRAYPNVITREGVQGLEYVKWSKTVTPEHTVTIPFTRMLAGPMDFTPGATRNVKQENFNSVHEQPMSMGTRCHQMAMFVVFESPLQMLCDSPSQYAQEPEMMSFLGPVPSVWDETIVLDAKLTDYVLVARQSGDEWWLGAMTDWTGRKLKANLDFLGKGKFKAQIFQDGANAHRAGRDFKEIQMDVTKDNILKIKMAPGGGWAARIVPVQ
ncbi:glycoside hydrolase family 97 protein, partial [candidate division KSB1 bacterium]|nr:glycoside hydrolase family 97 protein [candidate division KSB1 bacterium]